MAKVASRAGIALLLIFCLFQFQNCSKSSHGSSQQSSSSVGIQSPENSGLEFGGNGYDGKVYVNIDPNKACSDGSVVKSAIEVKIEAAKDAYYLIRENCKTIPEIKLASGDVEVVPPNYLVYKTQVFTPWETDTAYNPGAPTTPQAPAPATLKCYRDATSAELGYVGGFEINLFHPTLAAPNEYIAQVVKRSEIDPNDPSDKWIRESQTVPVKLTMSYSQNGEPLHIYELDAAGMASFKLILKPHANGYDRDHGFSGRQLGMHDTYGMSGFIDQEIFNVTGFTCGN
jgi:hypothetical protein